MTDLRLVDIELVKQCLTNLQVTEFLLKNELEMYNKNNKGGRPPKESHNLKIHHVSTRLNEEENELLLQKSRRLGVVSYTMDEDGSENKKVTFLDAEGLTLEFLPFDEEEKKDVLEDGDILLEIGDESNESDESNEGDGSNESQETDTTLSPNESPSPLPMIQPIVEDFEAQASMNPKVEVPVRHFILSYSPQDLPVLTDKIMTRDAKEYLHKMGYSDTQYLIVRHLEKNNPHVHIVANAVDFDGNRIPDKFDREKSVKICKEITLANGYTWGEHKSLSEAKDIHNPIDKVKYDLSKKIVAGIEKCVSITFLPEKLAQMGVGCQIKTDSKGLPVGISFSMKAEDKNGNLREYKFAGSHIDKKFSAKNIAIACQLHLSMPNLVNCAYKMTLDYEMDPNDFPMAKREYERLKNLLSRECRARKHLEYEYKDSKKKV